MAGREVEGRNEFGPPEAPRLGRAVRAAASDFYFNSWRLVPANFVWAGGLLAMLALAASVSALALLLAPLLALPTVGIYRLAALIARGEQVALTDAFGAWRQFGRPALVLAITLVAAGGMFGFNVWSGLVRGDIVGWSLATLAAWGLVGVAMSACVAWPILVDPRRETLGARARIRLALLLVVAHPVRWGALATVLGLLLVISAVAFPALITMSISFIALVATRYVLPAEDRLELRLATPGVVAPHGQASRQPSGPLEHVGPPHGSGRRGARGPTSPTDDG